jgi:hypothetical protein
VSTLFDRYLFLAKPLADGGYQGTELHEGLVNIPPDLTMEIVRRSDLAKAFVAFAVVAFSRQRSLDETPSKVGEGPGEPQPQGSVFSRHTSIRLRKFCPT